MNPGALLLSQRGRQTHWQADPRPLGPPKGRGHRIPSPCLPLTLRWLQSRAGSLSRLVSQPCRSNWARPLLYGQKREAAQDGGHSAGGGIGEGLLPIKEKLLSRAGCPFRPAAATEGEPAVAPRRGILLQPPGQWDGWLTKLNQPHLWHRFRQADSTSPSPAARPTCPSAAGPSWLLLSWASQHRLLRGHGGRGPSCRIGGPTSGLFLEGTPPPRHAFWRGCCC